MCCVEFNLSAQRAFPHPRFPCFKRRRIHPPPSVPNPAQASYSIPTKWPSSSAWEAQPTSPSSTNSPESSGRRCHDGSKSFPNCSIGATQTSRAVPMPSPAAAPASAHDSCKTPASLSKTPPAMPPGTRPNLFSPSFAPLGSASTKPSATARAPEPPPESAPLSSTPAGLSLLVAATSAPPCASSPSKTIPLPAPS